jgi:hypothetical protein
LYEGGQPNYIHFARIEELPVSGIGAITASSVFLYENGKIARLHLKENEKVVLPVFGDVELRSGSYLSFHENGALLGAQFAVDSLVRLPSGDPVSASADHTFRRRESRTSRIRHTGCRKAPGRFACRSNARLFLLERRYEEHSTLDDGDL